MTVADKIKSRRCELKLSRNELAELLNITPSAVANYENGVSIPKYDVLQKMLGVLQCDANFLFQDTVEKFKSNELTQRLDLSFHEQDIIHKYRSLDERGKRTIDTVLDGEYYYYLKCNEK